MIDVAQLIEYVIRPVLTDIQLYSKDAENLVLGTCCVESECGRWLHQLGRGPALGIYQMEPATYQDIYSNFLKYHDELRERIDDWSFTWRAEEMTGNLFYATAMCRVHYFRFAEPIPDNLIGQASMWKAKYNTIRGAGDVEDYIAAWRRFVPTDFILV